MAANRSWGKIVKEGFDWEKMCDEDAASTTQVPSSTQSTYRSWEKVVQEELDWAAMCAEDAASTTQVPSSKKKPSSTQVPKKKKVSKQEKRQAVYELLSENRYAPLLLVESKI